MIKSILTIVSCLIFSFQLGANVQFKVSLNEDNIYEVYLKPGEDYPAPTNFVSNAQISFTVPSGGFSIGEVISFNGNWSKGVTIRSPEENPGFDYFSFEITGNKTDLIFKKEIELLLFSFKNKGSCTGKVELMDNLNDPFSPPNSKSANIGNSISVLGAGFGNAYAGNYNIGRADCLQNPATTFNPTIQHNSEIAKIIAWESISGGVSYKLKMREKGQMEWVESFTVSTLKIYSYLPTNKDFEYQISAILEDGSTKESDVFELKN